ncbi:peptidase [Actinoplanes philippinensis]|nr:peptidase [Actinoplanes philippinensis]
MAIGVAGVVAALATIGVQQPADAGPRPVDTHAAAITPAARQAVLDYWTPDRISALTSPSADVPAVSEPDGAPWTRANALPRTVGRLFFTDHGEDSSCTATVLDSANRSTVVTAAHCVNNTDLLGEDNQWSANVLFIPGYRDGRAPYGRFVGRISVASATWLRNDQIDPGYSAYDQAFVVLNPNAAGRRVQDAVGAAQRIGYDVPGGRTVHQFGYPRASADPAREGLPEYTGQRLAYCTGTAVEVQEAGEPRGQWGAACVMGGGSSGGPRMTDFEVRTGLGTVVGDNSWGYTPGRRHLVGPQFTTAITRPLFETAQHSPV